MNSWQSATTEVEPGHRGLQAVAVVDPARADLHQEAVVPVASPLAAHVVPAPQDAASQAVPRIAVMTARAVRRLVPMIAVVMIAVETTVLVQVRPVRVQLVMSGHARRILAQTIPIVAIVVAVTIAVTIVVMTVLVLRHLDRATQIDQIHVVATTVVMSGHVPRVLAQVIVMIAVVIRARAAIVLEVPLRAQVHRIVAMTVRAVRHRVRMIVVMTDRVRVHHEPAGHGRLVTVMSARARQLHARAIPIAEMSGVMSDLRAPQTGLPPVVRAILARSAMIAEPVHQCGVAMTATRFAIHGSLMTSRQRILTAGC